jgi:uncharacterized SAM-binding protein YcdF (DUF218 family)
VRYRQACFTAAAVLLLFCSSGPGSRLLLRSLESRYWGNTASAPSAEAIVVLGGGLVNTNNPSGAIGLGLDSDRLWMAAALYRAGKAPLILVSGGSGDWKPAESVLGARILQAWGIPPSAILAEEESRDTHQNAVFSQRILGRKGINHILLVTSAVHMPRAYATFKRTGLTVFPVPADYLAGYAHSWLPSVEAVANSRTALGEWLGIAWYRLQGWA